MTDRLDPLERELGAIRPKGPSRETLNRLSMEMEKPRRRPLGDRFLIGAMVSGAMAACVILGVVASEYAAPRSAGQSPMAAARATRVGDVAVALAPNGSWEFR